MHRKRLIISCLLAIILIVIIGLHFIMRAFNQPVTSSLKTTSSVSSQLSYNINLSPKLQNGKYVSFDYPSGLRSIAVKVISPSVEDFGYSVKDISTWFLSIDISNDSSGQLSSVSSYSIRKSNPSQYLESHELINGQSVDIMSDQTASGFSKVAFILHSNLLATVSLLGDDPSGTAPLQTSFNMVLSSLKWH